MSLKLSSNLDSVEFTQSQHRYDSYFKVKNNYLDYSTHGELLCYEDSNGIRHSNIYKNSSQPVASITNARYSEFDNGANSEVYFDDFEDLESTQVGPGKNGLYGYRLSSDKTITTKQKISRGDYILSYWYHETDLSWKRHMQEIEITQSSSLFVFSVNYPNVDIIDDLYIIPKNAAFTSAVYLPGQGVISQTNARGQSIHFKYNDFGLPLSVLDSELNIIKKFEYK